MDMKKKLEDAYIPDKNSRKEKVVMALSASVDSFVMAYLLKIQKYDLIAVTVVNSWDEMETDQKKSLSCHINGTALDKIRDFCHKLNFPLHVIKQSSEFKERVIEPWMADKILGRYPTQCWNCHDFRMEQIYSKMKEIGVHQFATGHYAKVFHQENHSSVFVHTSNDELHDQSALLARLPHEILSSLLLPLSDLTKKEVLKLAENFGLVETDKELKMHQCLSNMDDLLPLMEKKIPKRFINDGEITDLDGTNMLGQHTGVMSFTAGEEIEVKDNGRISKMVMQGYNYIEKKIVAVSPDFLKRQRFLLVNCKFSEEVNWIEPIKGFVLKSDNETIECWLHLKTLGCSYVELTTPSSFIDGEIVSIVKKKGKNSKIYLTGDVQYLPEEEVSSQGEQSAPKFNHTLDF